MSHTPSKKNPIAFSYYDEVEERTYRGTFTLQRISIFGASEIETEKMRLSALGFNSGGHELLIEKIATLQHMIKDIDEEGAKIFQTVNTIAELLGNLGGLYEISLIFG